MLKKLHIMVGLPRSGKSTAAKQMGFPIVNPDSIRYALHGNRFILESEPMVWVIAKYMVKSLFIAGHDDVVLDATNTTRKRRDEWNDPMWECAFEVIDTPEWLCIQRAKNENDFEIIPIIQKMAANFEHIR